MALRIEPRVAAKVTGAPTFGAPLEVHSTVTITGVLVGGTVSSGIDRLAAGVVIAKLSLLTAIGCVAVSPSAVAVSVSAPATVAVSCTVAWPVESVATVAALSVLPLLDANATWRLGMPRPEESVSTAV